MHAAWSVFARYSYYTNDRWDEKSMQYCVANLISYISSSYYQYWSEFDKVIAKIQQTSCYWDMMCITGHNYC